MSVSFTATFDEINQDVTATFDENINFYDDSQAQPIWCANGRVILDPMEFPDTVTDIPSYAYNGCIELKTMKLPSNLNTIGGSAFATTGLISIDIPTSTTLIDVYCFSGNSELEHVNFNNAPITIGRYAFRFTSKLTKITFPGTVVELQDSCFLGGGLETIIFEGVTPPNFTTNNAFMNCPVYRGIGAIYVPDESLDVYKSTSGLQHVVSVIKPMSEYEGVV